MCSNTSACVKFSKTALFKGLKTNSCDAGTKLITANLDDLLEFFKQSIMISVSAIMLLQIRLQCSHGLLTFLACHRQQW